MLYDQKSLNKILPNASVHGGFNNKISRVAIDSRQVFFPTETLFFAFKGHKQDGHSYIPYLIEKGVRAFVVSDPAVISYNPDCCFYLVSNVLEALQTLASYQRKQFKIPVIGITGSNGKTTVKEWLFQLLCDRFRIVRNPGSYNSQIGVPLSVMQINERHELGIFEAGISKPGEMQRSGQIILPEIGIFLNLGAAHDEGFESREQKMAEKYRLFKSAKLIIFRASMSTLAEWVQRDNKTALCWGRKGEGSKLFFEITGEQKLAGRRAIIYGLCNGQEMAFELPFDQDAYIENAMHCIVLLLYLGLDLHYIKDRISALRPLPLRLELIQGTQNSLIVNDAYSNDPESLLAALQFMEQNAGKRKRILVLSDFKQSNQNVETTREMIRGVLNQYSIDYFIGYGALWTDLINDIVQDKTRVYACSDSKSLEDIVLQLPIQNSILLIKGARMYRLERLAAKLSAVKHQTRLEINLGALAANIQRFRSTLKPDTKLMLMLKASAYGSGDLEMADFIEQQAVDYVAVAFVDEGVRLRKSGMQLPIMVLNPDVNDPELLQQYQLEPEIFSIDQLRSLLAVSGTVDAHFPGVHIKLDTGMHRLGFENDDLESLIEILKQNPGLKVLSVFTHLIASERTESDNLTNSQFARFDVMSEKLIGALKYDNILKHVLNSSGILRFPERHMDMVRLGIGMYGAGSSQPSPNQSLIPVHTLKAIVSQVKNVSKGETVGYGAAFVLESDKKVATITIGYADGYLRKAGHGVHKVWINDCFAPTIGSVCMDMTMIDVTQVPDVKPGDEVEIFGPNNPLEHLARVCDTISYEVLSRISSRVKRVFVKDW